MTRGIDVVRRGPAEAGHYVRTMLDRLKPDTT